MGERPIRVVTMVDVAGTGGAERMAEGIAIALAARGFEMTLCATRGGSPPENIEALEQAGVRFLSLGRGHKGHVHRWPPLVRLLRRERVDILHSHKHGANVNAALIVHLAGTRLIATEHTWSFVGQRFRRFTDRQLVSRSAQVVVAVSEADRRRMIEVVGMSAERVRVIPTCVMPRAASTTPAPRIRSDPALRDAILVGTICHLRPQKRVDRLIRAFAAVRRESPRLHLVVVGDGPEREALLRLVDEEGIADAVTWLGNQEDVDGILRQFDVFAMSSDFEGSPLALIEAMAARVPIVATDVGGIPEILDGGRCGTIVDPTDDAFADGLRAVCATTDQTAARVEAADARATEVYSFESVVDGWADLYREVAHGAVT